MSTARHSLQLHDERRPARRVVADRSVELARRALDVGLAATILVLVVPLLLLIVVAVRAEGGGPALFRQHRAGRGRAAFAMLKFRTMRQDLPVDAFASCAPGAKDPCDPRITRVGRILRRTSLDELPQLVNVLRGDMSIVGPRPLPLHEAAQVPAWAASRFSVSPGITGLWQVKGRSHIPWDARMDLDVRYVESRSLAMDARLVAETVGAVVTGRGAY